MKRHSGTPACFAACFGLWVALACLAGAMVEAASPHSSGQPRDAGFPLSHAPAYVSDELLVRFKEGVSRPAMVSTHGLVGAQELRRFDIVRNLVHVRLPRGTHVKEAIERYRQDPTVLYAEPNYRIEALAVPNDPGFGDLWGLHNTGQIGGTPGADIDAPLAWDLTTGSSSAVVAVIDTGIDYTHQDLSANMFRNTADCNTNGLDDDGNGFIDDCFGIDAVNNDSDPMDDHGHGTHVAGTMGAIGNNTIGVVGINWDSRIMACKFLDFSGSGDTAVAIRCLDYVKTMKDRGVNIIATPKNRH